MSYHEQHTNRIGVAYCDPRHYTNADLAAMFGNLVINGILDLEEPRLVAAWARLAAHYGFLGLEERGQFDKMRKQDEAARMAAVDAEVEAQGWAVIRQAFGRRQSDRDEEQMGADLARRFGRD